MAITKLVAERAKAEARLEALRSERFAARLSGASFDGTQIDELEHKVDALVQAELKESRLQPERPSAPLVVQRTPSENSTGESLEESEKPPSHLPAPPFDDRRTPSKDVSASPVEEPEATPNDLPAPPLEDKRTRSEDLPPPPAPSPASSPLRSQAPLLRPADTAPPAARRSKRIEQKSTLSGAFKTILASVLGALLLTGASFAVGMSFGIVQYGFGTIYQRGIGVSRDEIKAVEWYRQAAERGHTSAQYKLGLRYELGEGVARDHAEAVKWWRLAAEQGNDDAEARLKLDGLSGDNRSVPQEGVDIVPPIVAQNDNTAAGNPVPKSPDSNGQSGDRAEAVAQIRRAAERGDSKAQFRLGLLHTNGVVVPQDHVAAVRWFRLAAEQGDAGSQHYLGFAYASGLGVTQDSAEAAKWYRLAAEQGYAEAQHNLGVLYSTGQGVPTDDDEAAKWWQQAAEQDFVPGHNSIGKYYRLRGELDRAIASYSKAIEIDPNYKEAYVNRADAYRDQQKYGLAIADYEQAIEIDPNYSAVYNQFAWLLATSPNLSVRDGRRAVELGEKAISLKPEDPAVMDTLAAAYAEADQFADAVRTQQRAVWLLKSRGQQATADYEDRLALYRQGKPFPSP
jgi:TPR repeat protein